MRFVQAALAFAVVALQVAATPVKRAASGDAGYVDPSLDGGSMLTIVPGSKTRIGEPINVIISNQSDPWVLTDYGFTNYSRSLNFQSGDVLTVTYASNQRANLGDGYGSRIQAGIQRYNDSIQEALNGGNHFRYWFQRGKNANTGAVFIAASVEKSKDENHMIVDNGYDLGRDQLVGNATAGTTTDKLGNEYQTTVEWNDSLFKKIKTSQINHNISVDGRVAVLTVKVTKSVSTDGKGSVNTQSSSSRRAAMVPMTITLIIGFVLALISLV
ncbi:hypothetical protein MCUN1_003589 [Malassezia cuniculi]|uniref:Uncharacterized protein n=1 Tax=Malassezia cuniculi TaxID=948313 RepID=A0AAF0J7J8_9BASI|nr:hypothetical protein MCUN1_003589 [Malassezia cuniculi]